MRTASYRRMPAAIAHETEPRRARTVAARLIVDPDLGPSGSPCGDRERNRWTALSSRRPPTVPRMLWSDRVIETSAPVSMTSNRTWPTGPAPFSPIRRHPGWIAKRHPAASFCGQARGSLPAPLTRHAWRGRSLHRHSRSASAIVARRTRTPSMWFATARRPGHRRDRAPDRSSPDAPARPPPIGGSESQGWRRRARSDGPASIAAPARANRSALAS